MEQKKPFHTDKEGNIHIASFKNKNKSGTKYIMNCLTVRTFPFKFSRKIYFSEPEKQKVVDLLLRQPKFEIKQPKSKKGVKK